MLLPKRAVIHCFVNFPYNSPARVSSPGSVMNLTIHEMFSTFKQASTPFVDGYSVDQAFCLTMLQQLLHHGTEINLWEVVSDAFIPEDTLGYYLTVDLHGVPFEVTVLVNIYRASEALDSDENPDDREVVDIECSCFVYPEGSASYAANVTLGKDDKWLPSKVASALAYNAALSVTY